MTIAARWKTLTKFVELAKPEKERYHRELAMWQAEEYKQKILAIKENAMRVQKSRHSVVPPPPTNQLNSGVAQGDSCAPPRSVTAVPRTAPSAATDSFRSAEDEAILLLRTTDEASTSKSSPAAADELPPSPPTPPEPALANNNKKGPKKGLGPPRPLSAYNIFFRHERARLLEHSKSGRTVKDFAPPSPDILSVPRVRELLDRIPPDPAAVKGKRRKHRRTHGVVSFTELNKLVSDGWKSLDAKSKVPFFEIAREEAADQRRQSIAIGKKYREEAKGATEEAAAERQKQWIANIARGLHQSSSRSQKQQQQPPPFREARNYYPEAQTGTPKAEKRVVPGGAALLTEDLVETQQARSVVAADKSEVAGIFEIAREDQNPRRNDELAPAVQQWHPVSPDMPAAVEYELVPPRVIPGAALTAKDRVQLQGARRIVVAAEKYEVANNKSEVDSSRDPARAVARDQNTRRNHDLAPPAQQWHSVSPDVPPLAERDGTANSGGIFHNPEEDLGSPSNNASAEEEEGKGGAQMKESAEELKVKFEAALRVARRFLSSEGRTPLEEARDFDLLRELGFSDPEKVVAGVIRKEAGRRAAEVERKAAAAASGFEERADLGISEIQLPGSNGASSAAVAGKNPAPPRANNLEELAAAAFAVEHPAPPTPPDGLPPIPGGPLSLVAPTAHVPFLPYGAGAAARVTLSPERVDFGLPEETGAREPCRLVNEVVWKEEGKDGNSAGALQNIAEHAAVNDRIEKMRREVEELKSRTFAISMIRSRMRAENSKVDSGATAVMMPYATSSSSTIFSEEESSEDMSNGREKFKRRRIVSAELSDEETVTGPDLIVSSS